MSNYTDEIKTSALGFLILREAVNTLNTPEKPRGIDPAKAAILGGAALATIGIPLANIIKNNMGAPEVPEVKPEDSEYNMFRAWNAFTKAYPLKPQAPSANPPDSWNVHPAVPRGPRPDIYS